MTGLAQQVASGAGASRATSVRRLAIFTSHPIQYQAPLFRALAASGRVSPTVFFGSRHGLDVAMDTGFGAAFRWDVPLIDGYDHVFLRNVARRPDVSRFTGVRVRDIGALLRRGGYDALLVLGWHTAAHVQAVRAGWRANIPVVIRGESTLQRSPAGGIGAFVRRSLWLPARQRLYRAAFERIDAFLVIGTRNRDYYRSFGVPEPKFFWAPYGVDNERFALSEPARTHARARVRARLGVAPGAIVFASSAKLIARKRPLDLVDAVATLRRDGVDAHALFIGEGDERAAIVRRAADAGIADAVAIAGFVNQAELPAWYAAVDTLVLPSDSRETWGLVVNEAMAAGCPVVVSDAAGCAPDLVREGENGFTYPCGDVAALADRLARIAAVDDATRRAFGARSRAIVDAFAIDVAAEGTAAAVEAVSVAAARRGAS